MSGRGRSGGRSNFYGGRGRSGQQGGRGGQFQWNRNYQPNHGRGDNGASEKTETKPERFMLGGKPTTTQTNTWFRMQEYHAGEKMPKSGVVWIVSLTTPGDTPFMEPPELPNKEDYRTVVTEANAAEGIEEVSEFNQEGYNLDIWHYKEEYKEYIKKRDIIDDDVKSLFYSMKGHLTSDAKREIETKKGVTIWENEDPKELGEAIKEIFLAVNDGAAGNPLDAEEHRRRFANIKQRENQSVTQFYSFYLENLAALKVTEMSTGLNEDQVDAQWTEKRKVSNFVSKLDQSRGGEWLRGIHFRNAALPATLEEAFKEAGNAEKEYFSVAQHQRHERIGVFHGQAYGGRYGGRGYGGRGYGGRGYGGRSYRSAVAYGRGNVELKRDEDGNLCCLDHARGQCRYGESQCKYSHKQPVQNKSGGGNGRSNQQAKDSKETGEHIEQAAQTVRFANQSGNGNPQLGGGGGGSGKGTIASSRAEPK